MSTYDYEARKKKDARQGAIQIFVMACLFMIPLVSGLVQRFDLYLNGEIVTGHIVKRYPPPGWVVTSYDSARKYGPYFSYTVEVGRKETGRKVLEIGSDTAYKTPGDAKVYYNFHNPKGAVLSEEPYTLLYVLFGDWLWIWYPLVIFLFWAAIVPAEKLPGQLGPMGRVRQLMYRYRTSGYPDRPEPFDGLSGAACLALIWIGAWLLVFGDRFDHYDRGRVVQGEVIDIASGYSGGEIWYDYKIRYGGHENWLGSMWYGSVGDKVFVNYLPEDPEQAYLQLSAGNSLLELLFGRNVCAFTLMAIVSLLLFYSALKPAWGYYRYGQGRGDIIPPDRRYIAFFMMTLLFAFTMFWVGNRLEKLDLYLHGSIAEATVKWRDPARSRIYRHAYTVTFGKESFYVLSNADHKAGGKVNVYYNPDNTSTAVFRSEPYLFLFVIAGDYGWLFFGGAFFLSWLTWRSLPASVRNPPQPKEVVRRIKPPLPP